MKAKKGTLCAVCGFQVDLQRYLYSRHTGLFYCVDLDNCNRRVQNNLTWEEIKEKTDKIIRESQC